MNPNADKLPVPNMNASGNVAKTSPEHIPMPGQAAEKLPTAESMMPAGAIERQIAAVPNPSPLAIPAQQAVAAQPGQAAATGASGQSSDEDDTAIEKEYINKAKAIVQQTSTDPFTQAKEISKIKAELLKRRYGKELKLSEG
jgi:hypothetical protein